ncbi:MAG TPA: hypothetical protein VNT60_07145 [Deinococcales bacterium]|nr:hypothetical protein [Deinococcales bacterium]
MLRRAYTGVRGMPLRQGPTRGEPGRGIYWTREEHSRAVQVNGVRVLVAVSLVLLDGGLLLLLGIATVRGIAVAPLVIISTLAVNAAGFLLLRAWTREDSR